MGLPTHYGKLISGWVFCLPERRDEFLLDFFVAGDAEVELMHLAFRVRRAKQDAAEFLEFFLALIAYRIDGHRARIAGRSACGRTVFYVTCLEVSQGVLR